MRSKIKCIEKHCRNSVKSGGRCNTCKKRRWRTANPERDAWHNLRASAKRRNKPFSISFEYFLKFCYEYKLLQGRGRTKECFSVDCIIEELGYVEGNIQVLTIGANSSKENDRRKVEKLLQYDWQTKTATVKILNFSNIPDDCPF